MPYKPRPNFLGLVSGIVVQHQMDGKISRNGTIDLIQEFAELDGAMAWPALTDDRSRGDVQRSEETGGAMALVIVSATLNLARAASEGSAGYGSAPESDSSHPRTAPAHDEEGSCTSRRCLAPCRPTADRWIVETSRCDEDATRTPARCGSPWIDSSRSLPPTRDCSNALLLWEPLPG